MSRKTIATPDVDSVLSADVRAIGGFALSPPGAIVSAQDRCSRGGILRMKPHRGWSQGELAERVGSDARQISRYENGKITPSTDLIVKVAETFDVSLDYLLIERAARRPLRFDDAGLAARLGDAGQLSEEDRASLVHIIDALVARNRVKAALAQEAG